MNLDLIIKIQEILKLYMTLIEHSPTTEFDELIDELRNKLEISLLNSVAEKLKKLKNNI